jgi:(1->4)-alpha-D-glucan 1-alpha-D-glucosylmutase
MAYRCKRLIVRMSMVSELHVLGSRLDRISERNRWTRDFTLNSLTRALEEVAACFAVYRTYLSPDAAPEGDRRFIEAAVARAKRHNPAMSASVFDFVRDALLLRYRSEADDDERRALAQFAGKFQQLTGPIMAKGIEDTAFYRFNRLVSLNEVGGQPDRFGDEVAAFHRLNAARLPRLAHGLSSTSTHDTKRSEDVRARIDVLSEIHGEWRKTLSRWARWNKRLRQEVEGHPAPSANDEYLFYQTLVGVWPGLVLDSPERPAFVERMQQYLVKVVREAKVSTSWISPHESYERAVTEFIAAALGDDRRRFLADLDAFAGKVADHGRWNSLSQVLLKIASPGAPDFYQGSELWSLCLVDPDNRRPVDFAARSRLLEEILGQVGAGDSRERHSLIGTLMDQRNDGRVKLFVTLMALRARRELPELFTEGNYVPLAVHGSRAEHLVALARCRGDQWALAVAPRLSARLCGFGGPPPIGDIWGDTMVELPAEFPADGAVDVFTGRRCRAAASSLTAADLLATFPVAMLVSSAKG